VRQDATENIWGHPRCRETGARDLGEGKPWPVAVWISRPTSQVNELLTYTYFPSDSRSSKGG